MKVRKIKNKMGFYPVTSGSAYSILFRFSRIRKQSVAKGTRKKQNKLRKAFMDELPDDILLSILSSLTMKEAAIASVVSRRWRKLCRSTTSLNFDMITKLGYLSYSMSKQQAGMLAFVDWVNGILQLHQGPTIDEFRVCYFLNEKVACDIDRWILFALGKGVRRLELHLSSNSQVFVNSGDFAPYVLPCGKFTDNNVLSVKHLSLGACIVRPPGFESFKSLETLSLSSLGLSDDVFHNLLSNCKFLECLVIRACNYLVNLKVVGSTLRLKIFEIYYCPDLESIEISATNLASFRYYGPKIGLSLKCVPRLVEMWFGNMNSDKSEDKLTYAFSKFASSFAQLKTLLLNCHNLKSSMGFKTFPMLINLKTLVLLVYARYGGYCGFPSLLKSCQFLHRFELHFNFRSPGWRLSSDEITTASKFYHQYLKEVEVSGFLGEEFDMDLAVYLIRTATALEKLTIDTHDRSLVANNWVTMKNKGMRAAKERAKQLRSELPPSAELVIH